ncbi:MAG: hypothetical protein M3O71_30005 [Bacteroidota bacterium]|nr:hypothetical protein [Bacteroidota bacterium]
MGKEKKAGARPMAPEDGFTTLQPGEFAISTGTIFKFKAAGPITVTNKGTLTIKLVYAPDAANIQTNTGAVEVPITAAVGDSGIFSKATDIEFQDISSLPTQFTLDYDQPNSRIWMSADKPAYNLSSDAEKGRQID